MRRLIAVWNDLKIYSHTNTNYSAIINLISGKINIDPVRTLKANIISGQGYTISIRPYTGELLPIDVAFCEIVEKDIRLFMPEPFGSGFVIFDSNGEIELNEEELIYILNANLTMAINSIWHGLSTECYLNFLRSTTANE